MIGKKENNNIDSFLNSLDYWEEINLYIALLKAQDREITTEEAYKKAILDYDESGGLRWSFERALKSTI